MKIESKKIKIIQISSASHSFSMKDYEQDIFKSWYARVAEQIKHFNLKLNIECWTPEKNYKKEQIKFWKNIKFRIFPTNLSIRHGLEICFPLVRALKKEIKKAKKQNYKLIIHIHEYHSLLIYFLLLSIKKNKNIKIIAQHHGGNPPLKNLFNHKKLLPFFPLFFVLQFLETSLKKVDLFYALSNYEISYLKKQTNSKIKFQTMGISGEYFKKISKNQVRKKLNLQNKKYILFIGRIKQNKGIQELLDAVKKLNKQNIELLLIGDGPDYEKYRLYAKQNNISAKFLGLIYGNKKFLYLSACDCLVLPSYTEGCPVVLMEAIAMNLPVIATNVGGINKMIENNKEGIIIRPKSSKDIVKAVKKILNWKNKNLIKYAKKYKWDKIIKETCEDYKD